MKRDVDYTWRLAELMAAHGMHNSTDLIPRLAERGIQLSRPQVYRIVHPRPERVAIQLLAALCDILGCGVDDLVLVTATDARKKKTARAPLHHPMSSNSISPSDLDEHGSSPMATINHTPRSTTRGRPRVTTGALECSRCHRLANTLRVNWPQDQLCHSCFYTAMRTRGICPACGHEGVLPGRVDDNDARPVCLTCAGIPGDFTCKTCGQEGELHRRGECARCALRDDLCRILLHHPADMAAMQALIEVLCAVDRPESILTWNATNKCWNCSAESPPARYH